MRHTCTLSTDSVSNRTHSSRVSRTTFAIPLNDDRAEDTADDRSASAGVVSRADGKTELTRARVSHKWKGPTPLALICPRNSAEPSGVKSSTKHGTVSALLRGLDIMRSRLTDCAQAAGEMCRGASQPNGLAASAACGDGNSMRPGGFESPRHSNVYGLMCAPQQLSVFHSGPLPPTRTGRVPPKVPPHF